MILCIHPSPGPGFWENVRQSWEQNENKDANNSFISEHNAWGGQNHFLIFATYEFDYHQGHTVSV